MTMRLPRAAALAVAATLALAACGGGGTGPDDAAAPGTAAEDAAFPRTVEHAMGATEIPAEPERVVVLDTGELDSALSLGVTPVGAVTTDVSEEFLSYLAEDAEGIEVVGTIAEPNLEEIASLAPDLILSNSVRHEDIYEQLSHIAPTVFAEFLGVTWKDNLRLAAEALGREGQAEELIAQYEDRAGELGEELGNPAETTVGPIRFVGGPIRAYQPESFIGTVLADIGLDHVDLPEGEIPTFVELSAEEITRADADVILYSSFGPAAESGEAAVVAGPLWPMLEAVQAGQAFQVEDDVFYTGIGLRAATLQVERLRELLAG